MSSPPAALPPLALPGDSPFIAPSAVEAWDAWFRWRCDGELRDLTVEASWQRVASALAAAEGADAAHWRERFRQAIAAWQLLPDPRLLHAAGTGQVDWPATDLAAELNLSAFVRDPFGATASFDRAAFRDTVELAVRLLDDAIALHGPDAGEAAPRLRIGMIGFADALDLLGIAYGSSESLDFAADAAALLAEAAFAASVQLARERGARVGLDAEQLDRARRRALPEHLIEAAQACGLRHAALTAIDSQPRLALFANDIADALEPLCDGRDWRSIDAPGGLRRMRGSGFTHSLRRLHQAATGRTPPPHADAPPCMAAQIRLRAHLARWIDAPIDYAFGATPPDAADAAHWAALAASYSLPPPRWRDAVPAHSG